MAKKSKEQWLDTFMFPDIPLQYPVYAFNEEKKLINFKGLIYPSPKSKRKFSRAKQLSSRSLQAKMFDMLIRIGYFDPLQVWTEFPVVIQNSLRVPGQSGMYLLLDYYFPELHLAVELDSELHNTEKDRLRDQYLAKLGIQVHRLNGLHKPSVQGKEFKVLTARMRSIGVLPPLHFDFQLDIREWVREKTRFGTSDFLSNV